MCDIKALIHGFLLELTVPQKQERALIQQEADWATKKSRPTRSLGEQEQSQMEGTSNGTPFMTTPNTTLNGKNV